MTARAAVAAIAAIAALTTACSAPGWQSAPLPTVADPSTRQSPPPAYRLTTQATRPAGWSAVPWKVKEVAGDRVYLATDTSGRCGAAQRYTLRTDLRTVAIGVYDEPVPANTICTADRVERLGRPYVQVVGGVAGRRIVRAG